MISYKQSFNKFKVPYIALEVAPTFFEICPIKRNTISSP